jgi:hypothetical protein
MGIAGAAGQGNWRNGGFVGWKKASERVERLNVSPSGPEQPV